MWIADRWKDYEVLDASGKEKLERWGNYILLRPDPQVIWNTERKRPEWKKLNAHYHRSDRGGGEWEFFDLPEQWSVKYTLQSTGSELVFNLKPFSFKHTGLFPEQAVNWEWFSSIINRRISENDPKEKAGHARTDTEFKVLNLFAYTGGATLAAACAGAHVTHVDASKGMTTWARENANSSGIPQTRTRWIVDDCKKFVEREIRRGNHYQGIIMDPPSYGRGPKGEIWKIEDSIYDLIELCSKLLADDASFFLINSYTTGLAPSVLTYMLGSIIVPEKGGSAQSDEIGLPVTSSSMILPCGASGRWSRQ